jgi:hypothetical protein
MAHKAVEIERGRRTGMGLDRQNFRQIKSMTTDSSDLLSNGRSFTVTALV